MNANKLPDRLWEARPDGYFVNRFIVWDDVVYWVFTADRLRLNKHPIKSEEEAEALIEQHKNRPG